MTDASAIVDRDVQDQLAAKDQLIRALTDRLEEAAEQLDRVQRTGGSLQSPSGGRSGGAGGTDLAAGQKAIIDQLTEAAEFWDEVDPKEAFARVEERLDELRQMLDGSLVAQPAGERSSTSTKSKERSLSGWEKMKAELMGEAAAPPKSEPKAKLEQPPAPIATPVVRPTGEAVPVGPSVLESPLPSVSEINLPAPVDLELAERHELVAAIEKRDRFISELASRLRTAESRTQAKIDWTVLNNAPDELRQTLENLEVELNDRLRIAEVDLSLERARLSRIETRIHGMQHQIEERLKASGPSSHASGKQQTPAKSQESATKSWFGKKK